MNMLSKISGISQSILKVMVFAAQNAFQNNSINLGVYMNPIKDESINYSCDKKMTEPCCTGSVIHSRTIVSSD